MNSHKKLFLYALVLAISVPFVYAQEPGRDRATIPFSNPGKPGLVKVSTMRGNIMVKAYSGKEVIVEALMREKKIIEKPKKQNKKAAGLKLIQINSTGLTVREEENIMRISVNSFRQTVDLTLQVPIKTSLQLQGQQNGDITVTGVEGELDIDNINGSITLMDVSGSAIAHTFNGEVKAVFKKVDPDEPMSFTAWKGDIDVTLPAAVKANMKMKSDRGDVYTDFDFQIVRDPKEGFEFKNKRGGRIILSEDIPTPPEPPIIVSRSGGTTDLALALEKGKTSEVKAISFDKAIYAKVNGGGPVYQFKNINGDIMIRKAK